MMITLAGLLIVLFVLVAWTIFMPIHLRLDTNLSKYELSQPGIITISFQPGKKPLYNIKVFGFKIRSSSHTKAKRSSPEKRKPKVMIKRSFQAWLFLVKGVLRSIRLKKFAVNIDINDVVLSAQLVPILLLVNRGPVSINTNSTGQYYLNLEIEGRLNKILWTLIIFLTKK